jgi:hypothetical protein
MSLESWTLFTTDLQRLGEQMIARLPTRLRDNPQVQQEAVRLMLAALSARSLEVISADGDHPQFLPWINSTLLIFQPNADTIYRMAVVTPAGSYRIRGNRGSLRLFRMGQVGDPAPEDFGVGTPFVPIAYNDFNTLTADARGNIDVLVSPSKPNGYTGDWWQLNPKTTRFWLRQVAYDWATERDPQLSIERIDAPPERKRPDAAWTEKQLLNLARRTANTALYFVDHVEGLRDGGFINCLKEFDLSKLGGLSGQFYYEGAYELGADEALIVEAKVPETCLYWSVILISDLYETIDWFNNHSSLNGAQAAVDPDGVARLVICERDPGVPNWLSTAGYASGALQGRWTDCSSNPIPQMKKVALARVRESLHPATATVSRAERERCIRERRHQVQMRPLW